MEQLSSWIWCFGNLLFLSSVAGQAKEGPCVENCSFQEDTYYQGTTINDPSTLVTANSTACCLYCQCNEHCRAWSWSKLNNSCFLKDETKSSIASYDYTSGVHNNSLDGANPITSSRCSEDLGRLPVPALVSVPEDESHIKPEAMAFIGFVPAKEESEKTSCAKQSNTMYPGNVRLAVYRTSSANRCCKDCREKLRCFSWYFHSQTRKCVLNADVPVPRFISGYTGGAVF